MIIMIIILNISVWVWVISLTNWEKTYEEAIKDVIVWSYLIVLHLIIVNMTLANLFLLEVTTGFIVSQLVSINVILVCSNEELLSNKSYMKSLGMMSLGATIGALCEYAEVVEILKGEQALNKWVVIGLVNSWLFVIIARLIIEKRKKIEREKRKEKQRGKVKKKKEK